jgi:hypothetical protein
MPHQSQSVPVEVPYVRNRFTVVLSERRLQARKRRTKLRSRRKLLASMRRDSLRGCDNLVTPSVYDIQLPSAVHLFSYLIRWAALTRRRRGSFHNILRLKHETRSRSRIRVALVARRLMWVILRYQKAVVVLMTLLDRSLIRETFAIVGFTFSTSQKRSWKIPQSSPI